MNRRLAVLGNALLYTVSNLAEYAIGLVVSVVIARTLGPAEFGVFSYAVWLAGTLFFFGNHGTAVTAIRFTAEAQGRDDTAQARALASRLGRVQMLSVAAVVVLFVGIALLMAPAQWAAHPWLFVGLIALSVVANARYGFLHGVALGFQRYGFAAAAPVLSAAPYLAGAFIVGGQQPSASAFLMAYAVSCVVSYGVVMLLLRRARLSPLAGPIDDELAQRVRRHMWLSALLAVINTAQTRTIETFVLSALGTAAEVGFFAIAGTLTKGAVDILTAGLQSTLMPVMAHAKGRLGSAGMGPMVNTAIRYYWCIGLVVAGAGALAAPAVVHLIYGNPYAPAVLPVQLSLVGAGLALVSSVIGAFLSTQDMQDDRVRAGAWSLAFNVVAAAVLVPWLGLLGAALTYASVRVVGSLLLLLYFLRSATIEFESRPCLRMLLAAGLAVAAALPPYLLLPVQWGGLIAATLMTLLLLPLSVMLRAWKVADFQLLSALLARLGLRSASALARVETLQKRFAADGRDGR